MERELLSLDDPVWKSIPSFQNMTVFVVGDEQNPIPEPTHRDVTIKDLMMHSAGTLVIWLSCWFCGIFILEVSK